MYVHHITKTLKPEDIKLINNLLSLMEVEQKHGNEGGNRYRKKEHKNTKKLAPVSAHTIATNKFTTEKSLILLKTEEIKGAVIVQEKLGQGTDKKVKAVALIPNNNPHSTLAIHFGGSDVVMAIERQQLRYDQDPWYYKNYLGQPHRIKQEVWILNLLHTNMALGPFLVNGRYVMFMRNLGEKITKNIVFLDGAKKDQAVKIFSDLLEDLEKLHKNDIIALDIKPDNAAYSTKTNKFSLFDFGRSQTAQQAAKNIFNGSEFYKCPVDLNQHPFSPYQDIYALLLTLQSELTNDFDPLNVIMADFPVAWNIRNKFIKYIQGQENSSRRPVLSWKNNYTGFLFKNLMVYGLSYDYDSPVVRLSLPQLKKFFENLVQVSKISTDEYEKTFHSGAIEEAILFFENKYTSEKNDHVLAAQSCAMRLLQEIPILLLSQQEEAATLIAAIDEVLAHNGNENTQEEAVATLKRIKEILAQKDIRANNNKNAEISQQLGDIDKKFLALSQEINKLNSSGIVKTNSILPQLLSSIASKQKMLATMQANPQNYTLLERKNFADNLVDFIAFAEKKIEVVQKIDAAVKKAEIISQTFKQLELIYTNNPFFNKNILELLRQKLDLGITLLKNSFDLFGLTYLQEVEQEIKVINEQYKLNLFSQVGSAVVTPQAIQATPTQQMQPQSQTPPQQQPSQQPVRQNHIVAGNTQPEQRLVKQALDDLESQQQVATKYRKEKHAKTEENKTTNVAPHQLSNGTAFTTKKSIVTIKPQGSTPNAFFVEDKKGVGTFKKVKKIRFFARKNGNDLTQVNDSNYLMGIARKDSGASQEFMLSQFNREIEITSLIKPNSMFGPFLVNNRPMVIMQDLGDELKSSYTTFSLEEALQACLESIKALEMLHSKNVIWRDMKLANLAVKKNNGAIAIAPFDFGASIITTNEGEKQALTGTPTTFCPIHLGRHNYAFSQDIYAAFVVIAGLLLGDQIKTTYAADMNKFMGHDYQISYDEQKKNSVGIQAWIATQTFRGADTLQNSWLKQFILYGMSYDYDLPITRTTLTQMQLFLQNYDQLRQKKHPQQQKLVLVFNKLFQALPDPDQFIGDVQDQQPWARLLREIQILLIVGDYQPQTLLNAINEIEPALAQVQGTQAIQQAFAEVKSFLNAMPQTAYSPAITAENVQTSLKSLYGKLQQQQNLVQQVLQQNSAAVQGSVLGVEQNSIAHKLSTIQAMFNNPSQYTLLERQNFVANLTEYTEQLTLKINLVKAVNAAHVKLDQVLVKQYHEINAIIVKIGNSASASSASQQIALLKQQLAALGRTINNISKLCQDFDGKAIAALEQASVEADRLANTVKQLQQNLGLNQQYVRESQEYQACMSLLQTAEGNLALCRQAAQILSAQDGMKNTFVAYVQQQDQVLQGLKHSIENLSSRRVTSVIGELEQYTKQVPAQLQQLGDQLFSFHQQLVAYQQNKVCLTQINEKYSMLLNQVGALQQKVNELPDSDKKRACLVELYSRKITINQGIYEVQQAIKQLSINSNVANLVQKSNSLLAQETNRVNYYAEQVALLRQTQLQTDIAQLQQQLQGWQQRIGGYRQKTGNQNLLANESATIVGRFTELEQAKKNPKITRAQVAQWQQQQTQVWQPHMQQQFTYAETLPPAMPQQISPQQVPNYIAMQKTTQTQSSNGGNYTPLGTVQPQFQSQPQFFQPGYTRVPSNFPGGGQGQWPQQPGIFTAQNNAASGSSPFGSQQSAMPGSGIPFPGGAPGYQQQDRQSANVPEAGRAHLQASAGFGQSSISPGQVPGLGQSTFAQNQHSHFNSSRSQGSAYPPGRCQVSSRGPTHGYWLIYDNSVDADKLLAVLNKDTGDFSVEEGREQFSGEYLIKGISQESLTRLVKEHRNLLPQVAIDLVNGWQQSTVSSSSISGTFSAVKNLFK